MPLPAAAFDYFDDHRGARRHRFMESADINAAFRELFAPLRTNIRRGLGCDGQLYAIEMDGCIPGEMLAATWIPPDAIGIDDPAHLADPVRRHAVYEALRQVRTSEALLAYLVERGSGRADDPPRLVLEIVSEDARYVAEYPITKGRGWQRRELLKVPHRRQDALPAQAANAERAERQAERATAPRRDRRRRSA